MLLLGDLFGDHFGDSNEMMPRLFAIRCVEGIDMTLEHVEICH